MHVVDLVDILNGLFDIDTRPSIWTHSGVCCNVLDILVVNLRNRSVNTQRESLKINTLVIKYASIINHPQHSNCLCKFNYMSIINHHLLPVMSYLILLCITVN